MEGGKGDLQPKQVRGEAGFGIQQSAGVSQASPLASLSLSFLCSEVIAPIQAVREGRSPG